MNPWPIAPLGTKDLNFGVVNYDFTGLTGGELTDLPILEAAIDFSLGEAAASVADQAVLIASMAGDLDDLSTVLYEITANDIGPFLAYLDQNAAAGDPMLGDLATLIG
jgi:hypothetical protein